MSYELTINEVQARVLINALELYSRIGMGQLPFLMEHPDIELRMIQGKFLNTDAIRTELDLLKSMIFPELLRYANYSISSPEIGDGNRVSYEILQVIRHRMAWDDLKGEKPPFFSVIYDEPMKISAQPLPTIKKVTV